MTRRYFINEAEKKIIVLDFESKTLIECPEIGMKPERQLTPDEEAAEKLKNGMEVHYAGQGDTIDVTPRKKYKKSKKSGGGGQINRRR